MHFRDPAVLIFYKTLALHKVSVHQAHFISREQAEIFLRGLLHEIVPLNIEFPAEWHLTAPQFLILQVICHIQIFHLVFRIIVDNKLDRIEYCHHTGLLHLQVFPDTVFKHRIVHRTLALGYTAHINEHLDGFRSKSSPPERSDRDKPGIVPSVYDLFFHQFLDIALSGHHVRQIQFRELDLSWRIFKFTFPYDPVIERSVILKLQCTDRVGDPFDRILDRMSEIIHGVDTPLVSGIVM